MDQLKQVRDALDRIYSISNQAEVEQLALDALAALDASQSDAGEIESLRKANASLLLALQDTARMLEGYAGSYAAMARQNPSDPTVRMTSVEFDIRQNMLGYVLKKIAAAQTKEST